MTSLAFEFNTLMGMHVKYRNATTQTSDNCQFTATRKKIRAHEGHSIIMSDAFEKENPCQLPNHCIST